MNVLETYDVSPVILFKTNVHQVNGSNQFNPLFSLFIFWYRYVDDIFALKSVYPVKKKVLYAYVHPTEGITDPALPTLACAFCKLVFDWLIPAPNMHSVGSAGPDIPSVEWTLRWHKKIKKLR